MQLHRGRGYNGFGPNALSWTEIRAYCQLTRADLDPWEIEAIRALDDVYFDSLVDAQVPVTVGGSEDG